MFTLRAMNIDILKHNRINCSYIYLTHLKIQRFGTRAIDHIIMLFLLSLLLMDMDE